MKKLCILTLEESDQLIALLVELPIKYLPLVQQIQQFLQGKFLEEAEPVKEN